MDKRYAIVEVGKDGNCLEEFICSGNCNKCDYGDTKEQLISKVAQGIIIASKKKQIYIGNPKAFSKAVAEIIVEFLGVE